jgi:hypothetical protein
LSAQDEELEEYWDTLRSKPMVQVVPDRPSELSAVLDLICEQTVFDVRNSLEMYLRNLTEQDQRAVNTIVARGLRSLKTNWLKELEGKNLTGLIEFILQGANLSPTVMMSFIQALPLELLRDICSSTLNTANGVHALMGVEVARRQNILHRYTIGREGGRIRVEFQPYPREDVIFYLDESFELIEERLQVLDRPEEDIPF